MNCVFLVLVLFRWYRLGAEETKNAIFCFVAHFTLQITQNSIIYYFPEEQSIALKMFMLALSTLSVILFAWVLLWDKK